MRRWLAELRLVVRETALVPAALALALLCAGATLGGLGWLSERERAEQLVRDAHVAELQWVDDGFVALERGERARRDPSSPLYTVRRLRPLVAEPRAALAFSASGTSEFAPAAWSQGDRRVGELPPDEPKSPAQLASGRFDLAFVVTLLLPWFAILLAHRLASGERESGRWALLSSLSPHPWRLLAKRAVLGCVVLAGASVASVALVLALRGRLEVELLPALLAWSALVALVLAFWTALSLAVGALGRSSTFNLGALAFAWVLLCWALPVATAEVALARHPPADRTAVARLARAEAGELWEGRAEYAREALLRLQVEPTVVDAGLADPKRKPELEVLGFTLEFPRRTAPLASEIESTRDRRLSFEAYAVALSPAFAAQAALLELAGTAPAQRRAVELAAQAEFERWKDDLLRQALLEQKLVPADFDRLVALQLPDSAKPRASLGPWLALAAWALAATLTAWALVANSVARAHGRRTAPTRGVHAARPS